MVFDKLTDENIRASYQHEHVVKTYLKHIQNKKVLDAGCWTGTMEKQITSMGIKTNIVGIDENKDALKVATKNFPKFKFERCSLTEPSTEFLTKYSSYFDSIIYLDVIEHIPKGTEVQVMEFFHKVLKPGGVIILSTMLDHPLNFIDPGWFVGHRHYKVKQIEMFLKKSKFKTLELLKIGNLAWDFDLLLLYIYKHVFKKEYKTSNFMFKRILKGLQPPQKTATRIYALAQKKN